MPFEIRKYRVLFLANEPVQVALVNDLLTFAYDVEFVVERAASVAEGMAMLTAEKFDVVLLDADLLDTTGWDAVTTLRTITQTPPLVIIANSHDDMMGVQAIRHGAQDYLTRKQLTSELLARSLHYAIERQRLQTERERALEQANEQLKELDHLKGRFVSELSHELRTPLTSIQLYVQLLQRAGPEKSARYFSIIENQCDRLRKLADDVLALSRGELTRRRPTAFGDVDLCAIVRQTMTTYAVAAAETDVSLSTTLPSTAVIVTGEQNQLTYALSHLLDNAYRFTENGAIVITISADDTFATLQVSDTGVGIPENELPYIFDRFFRGEQALRMAIPGNGLGLAIVAEIVLLHGGTISVESRVGEGTNVSITLPLAA
ncbi:MAG: hybrid sensor histidine kinase/response regulator [Anaerolineae bacterium]|nr:hybrid sensor histidine kinase/response regulator [Anaerolineae bacterium]MCO5205974.1 hybrid sensor histidine kinase/response regulator [Anaerolineae bacterium]